MTSRPYIYRITEIVKVTDADTIWARVDTGFRQTLLINVRLLGYDAPERNSGSAYEKAEAATATAYAGLWLRTAMAEAGTSVWVRTEKDPDSFGRWLGDVWLESDGDQWPERHLGAELRDRGWASIWPTRWREEFDD